MQRTGERVERVRTLRSYAGRRVRIRLSDGSEYAGMPRTELLSDRSIAVFIVDEGGEGTTIYIDDIVGVWATS